ncbi:MAG TPA: lipase [Gammaproteobacteria bacterium]|nr:lipase [Gammaproteobacteria bacterium]
MHGTGMNAQETWAGNYRKLLPEQGYPVCTVNLPDKALGDIQVSSEYVVGALRAMSRHYGEPLDVITHSQGGLEVRWKIGKYWPDVHKHIDDFVSLAAPNHGTGGANTACLQQLAACTASVQQQRVGSRFLAALNDDEGVPQGVSCTSIFSITDEVVEELVPSYTSAVRGASNVLVQDLCPGRVVTHPGELTDAAVYAITEDALSHAGPAKLSRVDRSACARVQAPGVTLNAFLRTIIGSCLDAAMAIGTGPTSGEPPLKPYARGDAGGGSGSTPGGLP